MSGGRSVSPSLVSLTRTAIESVSVRRRENFEIQRLHLMSRLIVLGAAKRSLWLLFWTRLEFVLRSVWSRRRKQRKDSLNESEEDTMLLFICLTDCLLRFSVGRCISAN